MSEKSENRIADPVFCAGGRKGNMEIRGKKLLRFLASQDDWTTARTIAFELGVSEKTVRNEIRKINQDQPCVLSGKKGYRLNPDVRPAIEPDTYSGDFVPETQEQRLIWILNQLLTSENGQLDLYDAADQMAVSVETVLKDLPAVKRRALDYGLFPNVKKGVITISGMEADKRNLIRSLADTEFQKIFMDLEQMEMMFPDVPVRKLSQITDDILRKYHLLINDYARANYLMAAGIALQRIRKKKIQPSDHPALRNSPASLQEAAVEEIIDSLAKLNETEIEGPDREDFRNLLLTSIVQDDFADLDLESVAECIGSDTFVLVEELRTYIRDWLVLDADNEFFIVRFALHIHNLLNRIESNVRLSNPLVDMIRHECPMTFEYACNLAGKFSELTGYEVSDDEIAYLAIHLGSSIAASCKNSSRLRAVLLLPVYYDFYQDSIDRLKRLLDENSADLLITDSAANIRTMRSDLIISVLPDADDDQMNVVKVSPFFRTRDMQKIKSQIDELRLDMKRKSLREVLDRITEDDLFQITDQLLNADDVIRVMSSQLIGLGYAGRQFYKDLLIRENQSSTAFGKIAVPHTFKMSGNRLKLNILLSPKPIDWNGAPVNAVLMFTISEPERSVFFDVFDHLVTSLVDSASLQHILQSRTREEFIENLLDCLELD